MTGNLLESKAEAYVNTVNTVGVMGKGIALMFKEAFPENYSLYHRACEIGDVKIGRMFVTRREGSAGPRWIINFPTKEHWRNPSRMEWIEEGLKDLARVIGDLEIRSVAIPPLGAGNGGLDWTSVRPRVEAELAGLRDVDVLLYEPAPQYRNVAKSTGVQSLTPARALIAEIVRRYWVLGIECTLLEIQKLAWFIGVCATDLGLPDPLRLKFEANRYGPYSDRLRHLLDRLDGSYLHCDKRISDAGPSDVIWFEDSRTNELRTFFQNLRSKEYDTILSSTASLIDGFESPLGMELLSTVDWLRREGVQADTDSMIAAIGRWPGGNGAALRKTTMFTERLVGLALQRLNEIELSRRNMLTASLRPPL